MASREILAGLWGIPDAPVGPTLNANRGEGAPVSRAISDRPPRPLGYLKFGGFLAAISARKGAASDVAALFTNSRAIMGESWPICRRPRRPRFERYQWLRIPHFSRHSRTSSAALTLS